jgi:hypothetical protein
LLYLRVIDFDPSKRVRAFLDSLWPSCTCYLFMS